MIGKLLSIITIADLQQLNQKKKPMIYNKAVIKIYNWCFGELVYTTYGKVKLEKYLI